MPRRIYMNPFKEKPVSEDKMTLDWKTLYPKPYNKMEVDPWTKCRVILMNGIEVEAIMFGHNFHRNCADQELCRKIAETRRTEQQQQKTINWLSPGDETQLEQTIGYEHLAVDLTAWLAMNEPDDYVRQCLDFALLEDFDHLYRYSNLLDMDMNIPSQKLVKELIEITPGRPTIAHHRHPFDTVRKPCNFKKADVRTILSTLIITAGEQQTMNFYMNMGPTYGNDLGRALYMEIGMVEEQHVTHYGSLLDKNSTWLENLLLRDYVEAYLYWSFATDEVDSQIKKIWEMHFEQEVHHLHEVKKLLEQYEKKSVEDVIPGGGAFPEPLHFKETKEYVRKVLAEQVRLTADKENFVPIDDLPKSHEFFEYQEMVNKSEKHELGHVVIAEYIKENIEDYRYEDEESAVPELRDRQHDNTTLGRVQGK